MATEQCWCLAPNDSRCPHLAVPGSHFCAAHNRPNRHPLSVWRATEAETPPDLVAAIRAFCPEFGFLAPAAPSWAEAAPSAPAAKEGFGRLAPAAAVPASPVLASEAPAA